MSDRLVVKRDKIVPFLRPKFGIQLINTLNGTVNVKNPRNLREIRRYIYLACHMGHVIVQ